MHALKLLERYCGVVQCDGYAAYTKLTAEAPGEAVTLAFCWAHLRRRFYDLVKGGNAPIASEALERIAALYPIKKTIRGASAENGARCARRRPARRSTQNMARATARPVSRKVPIAEDIRYGLNHWDGLTGSHASPIESCKLNDVDPQVYFANVLAKLINLWPASRIDDAHRVADPRAE